MTIQENTLLPPQTPMDADDKLFCHVALDGLKTYRRVFTVKYLKKHGLPYAAKDALAQMWARIWTWMMDDPDPPARCHDLLEYVDDLKMWGRQRVFLYKIDRDYVRNKLSTPDDVRKLVGSIYDEPVYSWAGEMPFIGAVRHIPKTGVPKLLVFKLIDTCEYDDDSDAGPKDDRSTNFFVVNLQEGYAELRIQALPTGATRRLEDERLRLEALIRKHIDFASKPIELEPVMAVMLRDKMYSVKSARVVEFPDADVEAPVLVTFLKGLFRTPVPREVTAFSECDQNVLGQCKLHFRLNGSHDQVAFDGLADPARVDEILKRIVGISRDPSGRLKHPEKPALFEKMKGRAKGGWVDKPLAATEGKPKAQAVILSAGVIAATVLWFIAELVGNYVIDEWVEVVLAPIPLAAITIPLEFVWFVHYYGWDRVWRSFKVLTSLRSPEVRTALKEARARSKGAPPARMSLID